jgi:hypothetical protein
MDKRIMGIKAIKAVEPEVEHGILEVDLSEWAGEGAMIKFRQPKAADYFPDAGDLQKLRISYAEVAPNLLVNCLIIGKCYIPDMDDPSDVAFIRVLLDLSRKNTQAFYAIYWSFIHKYIDVPVTEKVEEAKNDSAV